MIKLMTVKRLVAGLLKERNDIKNVPVGHYADESETDFVQFERLEIQDCLDMGFRCVLRPPAIEKETP